MKRPWQLVEGQQRPPPLPLAPQLPQQQQPAVVGDADTCVGGRCLAVAAAVPALVMSDRCTWILRTRIPRRRRRSCLSCPSPRWRMRMMMTRRRRMRPEAPGCGGPRWGTWSATGGSRCPPGRSARWDGGVSTGGSGPGTRGSDASGT